MGKFEALQTPQPITELSTTKTSTFVLVFVFLGFQ